MLRLFARCGLAGRSFEHPAATYQIRALSQLESLKARNSLERLVV